MKETKTRLLKKRNHLKKPEQEKKKKENEIYENMHLLYEK